MLPAFEPTLTRVWQGWPELPTACPRGNGAVRDQQEEAVEAHEAIERVERMHGGGHERGGLASTAAVVVAVLAGFLAIATFLANEQVKDVITNETRAADLSAQFEVNDVRATIAENDTVLLRTVGTGNPKALAHAEKLETQRAAKLAPLDARLRAQIAADHAERA